MRDTLERAAEYSRQLDMYDRWHYLTGTREELEPVWQAYFVGVPAITEYSRFASYEILQFYGLLRGLDYSAIASAEEVRFKYGAGYDVSHPTPVWLIDARGQIRVKLGHDLTPAELAQDVRKLLEES